MILNFFLILILFYFKQRETRPKMWAYLLWKQTQFLQNQENANEDQPWKLYEQWMSLDESIRQSWLVAGGTIQSFEKVFFIFTIIPAVIFYNYPLFSPLVWEWNLTGNSCKNNKNIDARKACECKTISC